MKAGHIKKPDSIIRRLPGINFLIVLFESLKINKNMV